MTIHSHAKRDLLGKASTEVEVEAAVVADRYHDMVIDGGRHGNILVLFIEL